MKNLKLLSVALSGWVVVISAGCVTTSNMHITSVGNGALSKTSSTASISLFEAKDPIKKPYQVLGKAFVYKRAPSRFTAGQTKEKALKNILLTQAAELGADAVIKVHFSTTTGKNPQSGWQRWGSGIAIKFVESYDNQPASMIDFMVAVLPVVNYEKSALKKFKHDSTARAIAQYHLENNGYYAYPVKSEKIFTLDEIRAMDVDARKNLGERDAAYVLLLTMLGEQSVNIVIAKSTSVGITAQLVSKTTGEIVWENSASGYYAAGMLAAAFANESKEALYPSISEVFSSLPPYKGIVKKEDNTK